MQYEKQKHKIHTLLSYLQTNTIAQMLSIRKEGTNYAEHMYDMYRPIAHIYTHYSPAACDVV